MTAAAKTKMLAKGVMLAVVAGLLAGCATTPPPSKSAPCKRPANLSAYAEIEPQDCGPMSPVNSAEAAAAILAL